jgi:hypothetical protein
MTRHLRRWLNEATLRELGGDYDGRIVDVVEERLRNRFTAQKALEPVIVFEDGTRLCPNLTQRTALVSFWGPNTDEWVGRRLRVYLHRKEQPDKDTGVMKVRYEKRVAVPPELAVASFNNRQGEAR